MAKFQKTTPRVLIVEDDALLNSLLIERLEDEGVIVEACTDGKEALQKLEELEPNLVVLGLILPSLSGIELLARIRRHKKTKDASVIVLSQLHREQDRKQTDAYEVCEHFVKPEMTLEEMVESILKNLDCSRAPATST